MAINVLAKAGRATDHIVIDEVTGRIPYWSKVNVSRAYDYANRRGINPHVVYEAADMVLLAERLGVGVEDFVDAASLN